MPSRPLPQPRGRPFGAAAAGASAGLAMPEPDAWARGLPEAKQHEWLVDCYRMRCAALSCAVLLLGRCSGDQEQEEHAALFMYSPSQSQHCLSGVCTCSPCSLAQAPARQQQPGTSQGPVSGHALLVEAIACPCSFQHDSQLPKVFAILHATRADFCWPWLSPALAWPQGGRRCGVQRGCAGALRPGFHCGERGRGLSGQPPTSLLSFSPGVFARSFNGSRRGFPATCK